MVDQNGESMTQYEYEVVPEVPTEDLQHAVDNVDQILVVMLDMAADGKLPTADVMAQIMLANNRDMPLPILTQHLALMLSIALHRLASR